MRRKGKEKGDAASERTVSPSHWVEWFMLTTDIQWKQISALQSRERSSVMPHRVMLIVAPPQTGSPSPRRSLSHSLRSPWPLRDTCIPAKLHQRAASRRRWTCARLASSR